MKKLWMLLLVLVLSMAAPPEAFAEEAGGAAGFTGRVFDTGDEGLFLRAEPGTEAEMLAIIPDGTRISVGVTDNGWGAVSYLGYNGWVYLGYVENIGEYAPESYDSWQQAYLYLLQQEQPSIESYNWQKGYPGDYDYSYEKTPRQVSIRDIWGDDTPELIYVKQSGPLNSMPSISELRVVTFREGYLQQLLRTGQWDSVAGGGFDYCLFQKNGEKPLYAMTAYGDEYTRIITYRFEENSQGLLDMIEQYQFYDRPGEVVDSVLTYTQEYYQSGAACTEEEYAGAMKQIYAGISDVLMFSGENRFGEEMNQAISNGAKWDMTAEEAINYLMAKNTTVPNDLTLQELNGLLDFLAYYAWKGGTYDYRSVPAEEEWRNLLEAVIRHPSAVNESIYPGEPVQEYWDQADPRNQWQAHLVFSEAKADWILKNIFHVSDADLTAMKAAAENDTNSYLQDGNYYCSLGGVGGGYMVWLDAMEYDGTFYTIEYRVQDAYDMEGIDIKHLYGLFRFENLEGENYWTVYYMGNEAPDFLPEA